MEKCLFCKCKEEKENVLIENELTFAMLDRFPVNRGHVLFMTKRHIKDFFETTIEERNAIFELVDKAKKIIDKKYRPSGYNIGMNCGLSAGQSCMYMYI